MDSLHLITGGAFVIICVLLVVYFVVFRKTKKEPLTPELKLDNTPEPTVYEIPEMIGRWQRTDAPHRYFRVTEGDGNQLVMVEEEEGVNTRTVFTPTSSHGGDLQAFSDGNNPIKTTFTFEDRMITYTLDRNAEKTIYVKVPEKPALKLGEKGNKSRMAPSGVL